MRLRSIPLALLLTALPCSLAGAQLRAPIATRIDPDVERAFAAGVDSMYVVVMLRPVAMGGRVGLDRQMDAVAARQDRFLADLARHDFLPVYRYRTFAGLTGMLDATGLDALRAHPDVVSVEADQPGGAALESTRAFVGAELLHRLGVTGEGTTVAVLDSGIDTDHPDLVDDVAPGAWHFLGQGTRVGPGAEDDTGHGTSVSGVITSAGVVAPLGIAPDAQVLAVKVIDRTSGWLSDWAAGVDYVVSVAGNYTNLVAINASMGSFKIFAACPCDGRPGSSSALTASANAAKAAGIPIFAASLNDGSCTSMTTPACLASVVSVAAVYDDDYGREPDSGRFGLAQCFDPTTAPDQLTCFSNVNACTDLAAPGIRVITPRMGGGTRGGAGTSSAAPHVTAIAALAGELAALSPDALLALMKSTAAPTTGPCTGVASPGRVDAQAMLCALAPDRAPRVVHELGKVSTTAGGFQGALVDGDRFGAAVASPGDLDGDGVRDLLVGAPGDDGGGLDRGALWVLFLARDGSVLSHRTIGQDRGGFGGALGDGDGFGSSLAVLGDLAGDGTSAIAVGAPGTDGVGGAGADRGALWILALDANGEVVRERRIGEGAGGFSATLADGASFGAALAALPDLNGDGTPELAVGAPRDADGGPARGAVWTLFLDASGAVSAERKLSSTSGGLSGPLQDGDEFGAALSALGLAHEAAGVLLAIGARADDDGGTDRGAVWLLAVSGDGSVHAERKLSATSGGFLGELDDGDTFGAALAWGEGFALDGLPPLLVGAPLDDDGGVDRGAVWFLRLARDGTVLDERKASSAQCGLAASLDHLDRFGEALFVGRSEGPGWPEDASPELFVGAPLDDDGGLDRGAVRFLRLERPAMAPDPRR